MAFVTTDQGKFYPGYAMPLWANPCETFDPDLGLGERFRLILVESGSGILSLDGWRSALIGPVLYCLNELDRPVLAENVPAGTRAQSLYFHPAVVNSLFSFDVVRGGGERLPTSDGQDLWCLQPFVRRDDRYHGQVEIGPTSLQRVLQLVADINRLLRTTPDDGWPCRTRSYFLELLFLVERLYSSPERAAAAPQTGEAGEINDVVLYLHEHYREKITIAELARVFHSNRTTLSERFAEATGMPIMTYLARLRVRVASLMLRDTELHIAEVMERVGFKDTTHFGRTFRKYAGYAPSEYRERFCWMLRS